jgi:hypothetical protein
LAAAEELADAFGAAFLGAAAVVLVLPDSSAFGFVVFAFGVVSSAISQSPRP